MKRYQFPERWLNLPIIAASFVCSFEYSLFLCQSCHLTTSGKRNIRERKNNACVGVQQNN